MARAHAHTTLRGLRVSRPDVTIAVTCHDQASLVSAAVRSALSQERACGVFVVDDGSQDGSPEVAEALGVTVHRLSHRGALATFRAAVDLVETPFYCLLNADDELEPGFVARTRPALDDPAVGFVYTGYRLVGAASGVVRVPPFDLATLRWGNYVHGASLVRKAAYESVGGFDERFAGHHEDWALWVAVARAGWQGAAVDEPLLRYRRHVQGSRNPATTREVELARWLLFRRDPGLYGASGLLRLAASRVRLAITGR